MINAEVFEEAYKNLNPQQRIAVNQIDGPVMVIAGPGTGKTQILALRIANIMLKTDVSPSNILCLTYTDAGVLAMRNRLASFIGTDAYSINIHTYHSFCNQVIQENKAKFTERFKLDSISDIEFYELCSEIVEELDNHSPIKTFADDYSNTINKLKNLFGTMKKEGWTSDFIKTKVKECLEDLQNNEDMYYKRNGKDFKKGDFKQKDYDKAQKTYDQLIAATEAFDLYNTKMQKTGKYDFDDMINFVLKAFSSDKDLLADYQEKYQYVLVDEFQDSNGTQIQLLDQLLEYWDSPNVFVVGDEDQAIYRFQGADISNIQNFIEKYEYQNLSIVPLEWNYRSNQEILNASYKLISENKERLAHYFKDSPLYNEAYEKRLKSFKSQQGKSLEQQPVRFLKYHNQYAQDLGVVKEIEDLVQNHGVSHKDIAILYNKHKEAINLVKIFTERKIPYDVRYGIDVLEHKLVKQIVSILKYIDMETRRVDNAQEYLFEILHHYYLNIDVADVANIARHIKDNKEERWREVIGNREKLLKIGVYNAAAISHTSDTLNYLIKLSFSLNLEELLEEILLRMGMYQYIFRADNVDNKHNDLQVIATFFNFVKEETQNERRYRLKNLLYTLDDMKNYGLKISCEKIINNEEGVQLRTAHSSKGLEYKYVFLLNAVENAWEKKRGANNAYKLPENLAKEANLEEEQRRLFYVAMTRAEQQLNICIPLTEATTSKEAPLTTSKFVTAIENNISNEREFPVQESDSSLIDQYLTTLIQRPVLKDEFLDKRLINEALKNFTLSATTLNRYLNCKLSFYFEQVLKVPTAKSSALAFGSMIHNVLEEIFEYINEHKQVPSYAFVKEEFERQVDRYKFAFNERQFEKRRQQGYKVIEEYYKNYADTWDTTKFYHIEKEMKGYFEKIPLFGKLDNIEISNDQAYVVDYKTGNPDNSMKKLWRPTEKEPLGGDIWRQVIFYQILLISSKYKFPMAHGIVDFVEKSRKNDVFVREKIVPDLDSIEIVKGQIRTAWQGIQNHDFNTGCGDDKCVWCNFVKENYRKLQLLDGEENEILEE